MLKILSPKDVQITNSLFRERMDVNRKYLEELDVTALLQNFYLEAGIIMPGLQVIEDPNDTNLHWGWEAPTCQLRGHFLGHWLSAVCLLAATDNDKMLKAKAERVIDELARCQQLNGGKWIGSIPEKYFDIMVTNRYVWSPQYVMHKTVMGLTDAYAYIGSKTALEVVSRLADWYVEWIERAEKVNPWAVYKGESGGMLEVWARLYELTHEDKYMFLADKYNGAGMFDNLEHGKDCLTNCHANASIPLSHGSAKMYEITNDEKWKKVTEDFWKCAVADRGMYATSGQNAGEFWIPPHLQGKFLSDRDQEFCTVYNMVRTAMYLFKWTGKAEYGDYIERCLYNGFLAQQNKNTGMPTYFLPLKAGSKKKWGTKTHDFWCCHGTMVQAQTLYPRLIYAADDESSVLYVNQYIPSAAKCTVDGGKVSITQDTDMKYYNDQAFFDETDNSGMSRWSVKLNVTSEKPITLKLRIPSWTRGIFTLAINGEKHDIKAQVGYVGITGKWDNTEISLYLQSALTAEPLPDCPEQAAILDGPIVLAGLTGSDCGLYGENPSEILYPRAEHTYSTFPWLQNEYTTRNQPKNFDFKPLYDVTDEVYTVYFTMKK